MKIYKWTASIAVAQLLALAAPWAQAQSIYTCTDASGRKLTADRPIPSCADREQNMLNPSGTVRAKVGPTLTAQERAELEAREKQQEEEKARQAEEKRRERALLMRYPNKAVHDGERAEALGQINLVKQTSVNRLAELQQQKNKLAMEMEFYKKDPTKAPLSLTRQLDENTRSMTVQTRFIGEQDEELRRVNARFETELDRLKLLWAQQMPTQPASNKR